MAIISVHENLTQKILESFGFSRTAIRIAAEANAAVDQKQGNDASETNLHGMRGYVRGVMQEPAAAKRATEEVWEKAEKDIKDAIENKDYFRALWRLGEALHTAQDMAIHQFEAWPYTGIGNAIASDLPYMIMHGVRDLCLTPYFVAGGGSARTSGMLGVELGVSVPSSNQFVPSFGVRGTLGRDASSGLAGDIRVMGILCWGACPSNQRPTATGYSRLAAPIGTRELLPDFKPIHRRTLEPKHLEAAERNSRQLVERIKSTAGKGWDSFVKYGF